MHIDLQYRLEQMTETNLGYVAAPCCLDLLDGRETRQRERHHPPQASCADPSGTYE